MHRDEAILILAKAHIELRVNRKEALDEIHEDFSDWKVEDAHKDIKDSITRSDEFEHDFVLAAILEHGLFETIRTGDFRDIMSPIYDAMLLANHIPTYNYINNESLLGELKKLDVKVSEVTGDGVLPLFACPCCGADTLWERHGWGICKVCRWEDDGSDNSDASLYYSGPNKGLQLTAARIYFLLTGISNPKKEHSPENNNSIDRFNRSRFFEIDEDKQIIFEKGTDWWAPLMPPHLKPEEAAPKVSLAGAGMRDWPPLEEE